MHSLLREALEDRDRERELREEAEAQLERVRHAQEELEMALGNLYRRSRSRGPAQSDSRIAGRVRPGYWEDKGHRRDTGRGLPPRHQHTPIVDGVMLAGVNGCRRLV